jgi:tripartite-type tricarboxylate transporter receptor subunit TctC
VREKFVSFGYEPFTPSREEFNQYIQSESTRFAGIIKQTGASLD